jgi:hypothetical protein
MQGFLDLGSLARVPDLAVVTRWTHVSRETGLIDR